MSWKPSNAGDRPQKNHDSRPTRGALGRFLVSYTNVIRTSPDAKASKCLHLANTRNGIREINSGFWPRNNPALRVHARFHQSKRVARGNRSIELSWLLAYCVILQGCDQSLPLTKGLGIPKH